MAALKEVGMIGLGAMGKPMAKNLLKAGYNLNVCDVREEPREELARSGATVAALPKEVAEASEVILTVLRTSSQVEEVSLGDGGIIHGVSPGDIYVDMSTINPSITRKISKIFKDKNVIMFDAPMSGGTWGAEEGTLSFMVGSEESAVGKCKQIFQVLGQEVDYLGDIGVGEAVKVVNNLMAGINAMGMIEGLVLGVKMGVNPKTLVNTIAKSSGASWILKNLGEKILRRDFSPGFTAELFCKDLSIALSMASESQIPLFLGSTAHQMMVTGIASGFGEKDYVAMIQLLEKLGDVKVINED